MDIQVQKLRAALDLVRPAVMRASAPGSAADRVLFAEGTLTANNLELAIAVRLPEIREGDYFMLPYTRIRELVQNLNGQDLLTLNRDDEQHHVRISNSQGLSSGIVGGNPEMFPAFPECGATYGGSVNGDLFISKLKEMIPYVKPKAVGATAERPELLGVLARFEGDITMAATDTTRLAHQRVETGFETEGNQGIVVPVPMIRLLDHVWKNTIKPVANPGNIEGVLHRSGTELGGTALARRYLDLTWDSASLQCSYGDVTFACQLTQVPFPDYSSVIIGEGDHQVVVDAFELNRAIGQVLPVARSAESPVRLSWEPNGELLKIEGGSRTTGTVQTTAKASIKSEEGGRIAFNIRYLQDFLKGKEGRVLIECTGADRPARWTAMRGPVYQVAPLNVDWEEPVGGVPIDFPDPDITVEDAASGEVVNLSTPEAAAEEAEPPTNPQRPRSRKK